jgi:hypothetical protein
MEVRSFLESKKRHKLEKLALYTILKNRRNFKHFFGDGAIFIPLLYIFPQG